MESPPFENRSRKVQQWLDQIFHDDQIDDESSKSNSSVTSNGSFSIISRELSTDFEENDKALASLEFLMQVNEEVESKCQERNASFNRLLEKSRHGNTCLNGSIFQTFPSALRLLRFDRSAMEILRLLAQLWRIIPSATTIDFEIGHSDVDVDSRLNLDEFLIPVLSAMLRHQAEADQKRMVISSDCTYLEDQLRQLVNDKRSMDEEFEGKMAEKVRGTTQADISEYRREINFMRKKSQRYARAGVELRFNLHDIVEYDPETLSKGKLQENARRNEELRAEWSLLEKELRRFRDLPPSIELARIKLEEAKYKLTQLENQVQEQFGR